MTKRGLRDHFWSKAKESKILEYKWKIYDHALEGSPEKTYDNLLACLLRQIERSRHKAQENRKKTYIDHLETASGTQQVTEKDQAAPAARGAKAQSKYNAQAMAAVTGKANATAGNKGKNNPTQPPSALDCQATPPKAISYDALSGDVSQLTRADRRTIIRSAKAFGMIRDPKAPPNPQPNKASRDGKHVSPGTQQGSNRPNNAAPKDKAPPTVPELLDNKENQNERSCVWYRNRGQDRYVR